MTARCRTGIDSKSNIEASPGGPGVDPKQPCPVLQSMIRTADSTSQASYLVRSAPISFAKLELSLCPGGAWATVNKVRAVLVRRSAVAKSKNGSALPSPRRRKHWPNENEKVQNGKLNLDCFISKSKGRGACYSGMISFNVAVLAGGTGFYVGHSVDPTPLPPLASVCPSTGHS